MKFSPVTQLLPPPARCEPLSKAPPSGEKAQEMLECCEGDWGTGTLCVHMCVAVFVHVCVQMCALMSV